MCHKQNKFISASLLPDKNLIDGYPPNLHPEQSCFGFVFYKEDKEWLSQLDSAAFKICLYTFR